MYTIRRFAVRIATQQPTRTLFAVQPSATRIVGLKPSVPSLYRSFQSARIWRAENENKDKDRLEHESDRTITEKVQDTVTSAADSVKAVASEAIGDAISSPETPATSTLFVSNLAYSLSENELSTIFGRFGTVGNVRIAQGPDGRPKGFGWVELENKSSADAAIAELNETEVEGRQIRVQVSEPRERSPRGNRTFDRTARTPARAPRTTSREPSPPSTTLFIGNMSYRMSDRDLNDVFRNIQNVVDVRVAIDRTTGQPRGFAHADFLDVKAATVARDYLREQTIHGRQLRADYTAASTQYTQRSE